MGRHSGLLPGERIVVSGEAGVEAGEWDTIPRYDGESVWNAESGGISEAVHRMGGKKLWEAGKGNNQRGWENHARKRWERAKTHSYGERVGKQSAGGIWADGGGGKDQRNHSGAGIAGIIGYVLAIIIVDTLSKIFGEVEKEGTPFTENNIKLLKKVHIISIFLWVLGMAGVRKNTVGIVFVLVISAFRSVFEYGYKLQKEADETL